MDTCILNDFYSPAQRARFLASIPKRQSVRQFSAAPDVAQKSALSYAAARVCLPGVRIVLCESEPEKIFLKLPFVGGVTGTNRYAALIMDEREPHVHIHAGISGEAFVLEAVSLGLGACWLGTFRHGGLDVELMKANGWPLLLPLVFLKKKGKAASGKSSPRSAKGIPPPGRFGRIMPPNACVLPPLP